MEKALDAFWIENDKKSLPECIIIYRDGVKEDNINTIKEIEIT